jgi:hypothetical protein
MSPKTFTTILVALAFVAGCGDNGTTTSPGGGDIDTTPPGIPVGVAIEADDTTLTVRWNDNAEPDLAGYVVQRSFDEADWLVVSDVLTTSEFQDGHSSEVYFRVSAVDQTGNQSAYSSSVGYTAPNGPGPKGPSKPDEPDY